MLRFSRERGDRRTDVPTDATKYIIYLASRSIITLTEHTQKASYHMKWRIPQMHTANPLGITHSLVILGLSNQNEKVGADRNEHGTTIERVGNQ